MDHGPADERRLDLFQGFGQVDLEWQKIHGALELHLLIAKFRRKIVDVDDVTVGQHHAAFDHVLQLAHVARPFIGAEVVDGAGSEAMHLPVVLKGKLAQKMAGQNGNVLAPLAQGRQMDVDHVQPVEEVLAEPSGHDLFLQILVRGCHQTKIHGNGLGPSDPLDDPFLQHAQELDLHLLRQLADLVQKKGPALGQLEAAAF